jgi:hypothetical protein
MASGGVWERLGPCPHDYIVAYCAFCAGDRLRARREARQAKRAESGELQRRQDTISRQSEAIERQSDEIRRLKNEKVRLQQQMAARRPRRRLFRRDSDGT